MSVPDPPRDLDRRTSEHRRVSNALAAHDDAQLSALVDQARHGHAGIGGATASLEVDDVPLFVKRIPLTDREREPGAIGSTTNLFGLPARCHYGVGSPGFGAWRELAAARMTTNWVLSGRSDRFPLLHHWRVLPTAPTPTGELADIDAAVAYWGDDPAMRDRLEALVGASTSLVLFGERIPYSVNQWLAGRAALGEHAALAAAARLEDELLAGIEFMSSHGVLHFDAHFDNVLTDGHRVYFADFGLASSTAFLLSDDELALVEHARSHDVGYAIARLVNWLVSTFGDPIHAADPFARNDFIRACAAGTETRGLRPTTAAATIGRYAPLAAIVNDFYAELFTARRDARYPAEAVERELTRLADSGRLPRTLTTFARRQELAVGRNGGDNDGVPSV